MFEFKKFLKFDMIKQEFHRCKINHLLCGLIGDFIISRKSAESIQPGESTLHNPTKWFWSKAACPVWSGTDFYVDIEVPLNIPYKPASVSAVDKTLSYGRPRIGDLFTDGIGNTGIMYARVADASAEDETVAVNSNIAFYSFHLLVGIESIVTKTVSPLDALGVKRHDRRCGNLLTFATYLHDEFFYTVIQISFHLPFMEVPIHRLPFGEIMWKHAPLAAADQKIQDCLEYGAQGLFAVSGIIFKEFFVYIRPLTLVQMCLIEADFMHTNRFSSTNTLIEGLLCLIMFNLV